MAYVSIIHGGHRSGFCFNAAKQLQVLLDRVGVSSNLFNLADYRFDYCCGGQPCQDDGICVHRDEITTVVIPKIAASEVLLFFTPTYFNMPPALLKNFMDRCNFLLTLANRKTNKYAAWISGQTAKGEGSVESCLSNITEFSQILELDSVGANQSLFYEKQAGDIALTDADVFILEHLANEIVKLK